MRTTRRTFVQASLAATAAATLLPVSLRAQQGPPVRRAIPSTREEIPIVGLGTWITFNVGDDPVLRDECAGVMAAFFEAGGRMIDSSPMYGSSQPVIGYGLQKLGRPSALFSAEKVWTSSARQVRPRSSNRAASGVCRSSISFRFTISSPGRRICRRCSR